MIITLEEYYELGFTAADDDTAQQAIKRAGYIINGLTDGRALHAVAEGGERAQLIRQAVGLQAQQICGIAENSAAESEESVALGDFTYKHKSGTQTAAQAAQTDYCNAIITLLRAAGVMFRGVQI